MIHTIFKDVSIYKDRGNDALFQGRNLPSFVKDYIIRRYSDADGILDINQLKDYLEDKMPTDKNNLKSRLMRGEKNQSHISCCFQNEHS